MDYCRAGKKKTLSIIIQLAASHRLPEGTRFHHASITVVHFIGHLSRSHAAQQLYVPSIYASAWKVAHAHTHTLARGANAFTYAGRFVFMHTL